MGKFGISSEFNRNQFTRKRTHNAFGQLKERVKEQVENVVYKRTKKMRDALAFRRLLSGGFGRMPKYNIPTISKSGYKNWHIRKAKDKVYYLYNDAIVTQDGAWYGYHYLKPVLTGSGWSRKVTGSAHKTRLVKHGSKLFSKQMPEGLNPYVKRQKAILENEIRATVRGGK